MRAYGLGMLALLASCSNVGGETFTTKAGDVYKVERFGSYQAAQLPANNDLKMVDGDLVKFAAEQCGLTGAAGTGPAQCELYVQPDPNGTLIGYISVQLKDGRARFDAYTATNERRQRGQGGCFFGGGLHQTAENYAKPITDIRADFRAQNVFAVSANESGNKAIWEVEDDGANEDPQESLGTWYITTSGDKLRLEQERWNPCYSDSSVVVDDVFYRLVRLTRKGPAAK